MADYKNTLNILSTTFPMKAELNKNEILIQKKWIEDDIYKKILEKNKNYPKKTLHDGPPYANGSIHIGHALNKILKDIIVRRWNMTKNYSEFIPGWDTHGMPIEHALIKKGVNTGSELSIAQKRNNCLNFATEQIAIQKKQFMRLGMESDFEKIYCTFDKNFEVNQLMVFLEAIKKNLIFRDIKPVYWSWSSQTALAEAEIEYGDEKSHSIYVSFLVVDEKNEINKGDNLVIWTTTPWTLPANLAIAVNPKISYVKIKTNDKFYIIGKNCVENFVKTVLNTNNYEIVCEIIGTELENIKYVHPLYKTISPIILAEYVSDVNGTGLVHNAPGFGNDDYFACKKYNIKPYVHIDNFGKVNDKCIDKELIGMFYEDSNKIIIEKLKNANSLLKEEIIEHSVAHDWRTKKPVMYRATNQWFVNLENIKDKLLQSISDVIFPTHINKQQLQDMIRNRVEWCISRQRYWGVPIPIIFDENKNPILDVELIKHIIDIFAKEGTNIWFEKDASYFLSDKFDKNKTYTKETDILDVWFDSGTTFSVLEENKLEFPCMLYLEGKDQFRGWFNSSLINSVICNDCAPYKQLLGCGFVLDGQGRKMSKSIGNVIDPNVVCEKYGADILRLWVASSNYSEDVCISDDILKQVAEMYRKIRNTLFKFILANISDFKYEENECKEFNELEKYVLVTLKNNVTKINTYYENFKFTEIIETLFSHITHLSNFYFDIIKDTLYCDEVNNKRRRTTQTVLYLILIEYTKILAPIIPHTCEEVYSHSNFKNEPSIFLFESNQFAYYDTIDEKKWELFFKIRDNVFVELEKMRINKEITKNTQATIDITFKNNNVFTNEELKSYLNVAEVNIINSDDDKIVVQTKNNNLVRCERCWNYFPKDKINGEICDRCKHIIDKN